MGAPAGIVRVARRPPGWRAPGPRPAAVPDAALGPHAGEDLCFLAGEGRRSFLARRGGLRDHGGDLVDRRGRVLGRHRGHHHFTVGQRRGRFELADVCKPRSAGGALEKSGVTEVVSSVFRDGRDVPHHLALGTYVVFEGESDYTRRCFSEYATLPDRSGRYGALYRPIHMIGLELGISVASAALRKEPTGAPYGFRGDVAAVAKRDLRAGEMLDGEGGYTVWGKLLPARTSQALGGLPLGLAHDVKVVRPVRAGHSLSWADVAMDTSTQAYRIRKAMEDAFASPP